MKKDKNILIIAPNNYEDIVKKGNIDHYKIFKKEGDFYKVVSLYPLARKNLKENNEYGIFYQYGWKNRFDFLNKFKITKVFGTFILLVKLFFVFPFFIKKEKISIIRATDPYYMGILAYYYSKLFKIPFIISVHSDYDKGAELGGQTFTIFGSRWLPKRIEKFIYKRANLVSPISEYLNNKILFTDNIKVNKIEIFYHGISFFDFDNIVDINIRDLFNINKRYIIGYVARLSREKHCLDILYIVEELLKIREDFCILVAGNGQEYDFMKSYIKKNNLEKNIKLLGFQSKEVVFNLRKQSKINLCFLDGFSLIEACAASRPVIAYDVEWHNELVINNKTGYLIEENDINEVVNKINYLLENKETADELGKNAREKAFHNHDIRKVIEKKQKIYQRVIDEK